MFSLFFKLLLMSGLLTGGLKTYADIPLLNQNPELSGIGGILLLVIIVYVFPKILGFVLKFVLFSVVVLWICHALGLNFNSIVSKLSSSSVSLPNVVESVNNVTSSVQEINGKVSGYKTGNSFVLEGENIQLAGIDVPDIRQTCYTQNNERYSCGQQSRMELMGIIQGKDVECSLKSNGTTEAQQATCFVEGDDIAALMVREGWAIADKSQTDKYVEEERSAYKRKAGLWSGRFQEPKKWRLKRKQDEERRQREAKKREEKAKKSSSSSWQDWPSVRGIKKLFGLMGK